MKEVIIVAAGSGIRSGLKSSKVLYKVNGKEILLYSVEKFLNLGYKVIIVISKNDYEYASKIIEGNCLLVKGGNSRTESVRNGLQHATGEYIFIHDAARPMITEMNISDLEAFMTHYDAVVLTRRVNDSIYDVSAGSLKSVNRKHLLIAETPQVFKTTKIKAAYDKVSSDYSDDISLYQSIYDDQIGIVLNETNNFKITYQEDIKSFERLLRNMDYKIGHSYDIHRLVENKKLILGGIEINHHLGLLGHSDGDSLLHSIAESILGALGLGDLGTHFPDTDKNIKGIDSKEILKSVKQMLDESGYEIINIDSTIFAEEPKMNKLIPYMKKTISGILEIDENKLNIKATTYEKLDSIGNGLAIAAETVVLIGKNQ